MGGLAEGYTMEKVDGGLIWRLNQVLSFKNVNFSH